MAIFARYALFLLFFTPSFVFAKDIAFKSIYIGLNGPEEYETEIFRSKEDLLKSWLVGAIPATDLNSIVSKIDFIKKSVVVISFGKNEKFSGSLSVYRLELAKSMYADDGPDEEIYIKLMSYSKMGVVVDCSYKKSGSNPFVIVITDAFSDHVKPYGYQLRSFFDKCKPMNAGTMSE